MRAQVEIMGLLIIVIIISLLIVFAANAYFQDPEDIAGPISDEDLAAGMVGAIMNTHSNCTPDTYFSQLIIDCAKYPIDGGSADLVCHNSQRSCDFTHDALEGIFEETIDVWKKPYEFRVISPSGQNVEQLNFKSDIEPTGSVKSFSQPLSVDLSGSATIRIQLCIGGYC